MHSHLYAQKIESKDVSQDWWVQFIVTSLDETNMQDKTNYIGEHPEASDQYDSRDFREMPPFKDPFLTLYFPVVWDEENNNYTSDYRVLPKTRTQHQKWSFIVESDHEREINLSWKSSDSADLSNMVLIDEENEIEIDAIKGQYKLEMAAKKHHFSWRYESNNTQLTED